MEWQFVFHLRLNEAKELMQKKKKKKKRFLKIVTQN